ncbi:MAG: hypothetical protein IPG76_20230 [Acidobacteria bacterium]|nr:hypothetical protein [Acidobacteriota bacterium]
MSDLRARLLVLSFGGTWCRWESKELPALQDFGSIFSSRVKVFWVSINSSREAKTSVQTPIFRLLPRGADLPNRVLRDPIKKLTRHSTSTPFRR